MLDALGQTGDRDAALAAFVRSMSGQEAEVLRRLLLENHGEHGESDRSRM